MKRRSLKILTLALVMACSFGASAIVLVSAGSESVFKTNGASVRVSEPTGLRFETLVDKTTYEDVINDSNKSLGAFIIPKDYLESASITEITDHKTQFDGLTYLEKENITGSQTDAEDANSDYVLKYSIVNLHYYNYNRDFFGMFYIKTTDGSSATYQYATATDGNNERSIAYVANKAVENGVGSEADADIAYFFAIKADYLKNNPYDGSVAEEEQNAAAQSYAENNITTAKNVVSTIKSIDGLPAVPETVEGAVIPENLTEIENAYNALSATAKTYVSNSAKLQSWVEIKEQVKVENVIKLIDDMEDYKLSATPIVYNSAKYSSAQTAYESLTEDQKSQVTNYSKLKAWTDAAAKVMMIYDDSLYSVYNNTSYPSDFVFQTQEVTDSTPDLKDYGYISRVFCNGAAANVRLAFNNLPDLTDYDVVRFPIYISESAIGSSRYPLVYQFKDGDYTQGYRELSAGWNIVTVPVNKLFNGVQIGGNMVPAGTNLYYAVPYAEKLESGDKISSFNYETNFANAEITTFTDAYRATVVLSKYQDATEGTLLNVATSSSGTSSNYAFRFNNYAEYKQIATDSGATGVKFRIYKNGTSGSKYVYFTESTSGHGTGIKTITLADDGWTDVELTADEFARWNGYLRKDWGAGTELRIADFTIVK